MPLNGAIMSKEIWVNTIHSNHVDIFTLGLFRIKKCFLRYASEGLKLQKNREYIFLAVFFVQMKNDFLKVCP